MNTLNTPLPPGVESNTPTSSMLYQQIKYTLVGINTDSLSAEDKQEVEKQAKLALRHPNQEIYYKGFRVYADIPGTLARVIFRAGSEEKPVIWKSNDISEGEYLLAIGDDTRKTYTGEGIGETYTGEGIGETYAWYNPETKVLTSIEPPVGSQGISPASTEAEGDGGRIFELYTNKISGNPSIQRESSGLLLANHKWLERPINGTLETKKIQRVLPLEGDMTRRVQFIGGDWILYHADTGDWEEVKNEKDNHPLFIGPLNTETNTRIIVYPESSFCFYNTGERTPIDSLKSEQEVDSIEVAGSDGHYKVYFKHTGTTLSTTSTVLLSDGKWLAGPSQERIKNNDEGIDTAGNRIVELLSDPNNRQYGLYCGNKWYGETTYSSIAKTDIPGVYLLTKDGMTEEVDTRANTTSSLMSKAQGNVAAIL